METTIIKKVKGSTMKKLFETSDIVDIRYYTALNQLKRYIYDPEEEYMYVIKIRHSEEENARKLFDEAIEKI
jgi:hypothetical protein